MKAKKVSVFSRWMDLLIKELKLRLRHEAIPPEVLFFKYFNFVPYSSTTQEGTLSEVVKIRDVLRGLALEYAKAERRYFAEQKLYDEIVTYYRSDFGVDLRSRRARLKELAKSEEALFNVLCEACKIPGLNGYAQISSDPEFYVLWFSPKASRDRVRSRCPLYAQPDPGKLPPAAIMS